MKEERTATEHRVTFGELQDWRSFWHEDPEDGWVHWAKMPPLASDLPYFECDCHGHPNAKQIVRSGNVSPGISHFCPGNYVCVARRATVREAVDMATTFWYRGKVFYAASQVDRLHYFVQERGFVQFQDDDQVWIGNWDIARDESIREGQL